MLEKGYVQVYTGNGKGKTTAALGIALRAACAGNRVFMGQFMKGQDYSEMKACEYLPGFESEQFGDVCFVKGKPSEKDFLMARKGLSRMKEVLISGKYDMVIFDEINTALYFELVSVNETIDVIDTRPDKTEIILTGRYAPQEIIDKADLVTEMLEVKHYYSEGVEARTGIEN